MKPSEEWSIGQVAERFDLATNVLRHWESVGLLTPDRDSAGRRRYGPDHVVRIAVIVRSKSAGMGLEQIADLLDGGRRGRHEVLATHIADLDRRMAEMQVHRAMTMHAMDCRAHDIATCPHFRHAIDDLLSGF